MPEGPAVPCLSTPEERLVKAVTVKPGPGSSNETPSEETPQGHTWVKSKHMVRDINGKNHFLQVCIEGAAALV